MYIHLMEISPTPEKAQRQGDWPNTLVPRGRHVVHTAPHIALLCGDYQNIDARNHQPAEIHRKYDAAASLLWAVGV